MVQVLNNELHLAIQSDYELFNRVLGTGSAQEIMKMLGPCFNMTSEILQGTMVDSINKYHLWAHVVDPHFGEWHSTVLLPRSVSEIAKEMIECFIPFDKNGCDDERQCMMQEFEVSIFVSIFHD